MWGGVVVLVGVVGFVVGKYFVRRMVVAVVEIVRTHHLFLHRNRRRCYPLYHLLFLLCFLLYHHLNLHRFHRRFHLQVRTPTSIDSVEYSTIQVPNQKLLKSPIQTRKSPSYSLLPIQLYLVLQSSFPDSLTVVHQRKILLYYWYSFHLQHSHSLWG